MRLRNEQHVLRFVRRWLPNASSTSSPLVPIVLERLYESLVALRRRLEWRLSDVVHVRITHDKDRSASGNVAPPASAARVPAEWTALDRVLYDGFVQHLNGQMERVRSATFDTEVRALARLSHALDATCAVWRPAARRSPREARARWMEGLDGWCRFAHASEADVLASACRRGTS